MLHKFTEKKLRRLVYEPVVWLYHNTFLAPWIDAYMGWWIKD